MRYYCGSSRFLSAQSGKAVISVSNSACVTNGGRNLLPEDVKQEVPVCQVAFSTLERFWECFRLF